MKKILPILAPLLILAACTSTEGLSAESSRAPRGNLNAAVTITEFADLQCPACRAAHSQIIAPMMEQYGSVIRYEFKHFPIRTSHRYALEAAMAAECAADQGKFWEFVDHDYEHQDELSLEALSEWGTVLGLDTDLYERCRKTEIKKDVVLEDYKEGRSKDVTGTPTFFLNGQQIPANFDAISAGIEEALGTAAQRL